MPVSSPANKQTALRELIDERGLKYGFVASKIGCTPDRLTRLMNGDVPLRASDLMALCELLGVEAKAFFDGRELLPSRQGQDDGAEDGASGGPHFGTPPALGATA